MKIIPFLILSFLASTMLMAQAHITDAKSLLEASIAKTGGEKWNAIKTMQRTQTVTGDMEANMKDIWEFPSRLFQEIIVYPNGMEQVMQFVFTDKEAWAHTMLNPFLAIPPERAGQVYAPSPCQELLANPNLPIEFAEGTYLDKPIYVLTFVKQGKTVKYSYDSMSLLLITEERESQKIVYEDYREVEGVWLPFASKTDFKGLDIKTTYQYRFNLEIDPKMFEKATYQHD